MQSLYELLDDMVTRLNCPHDADQVWNLDDTCFVVSASKHTVMASKGAQHANVAGNANRVPSTMLLPGRVDGTSLAPLLITKGKSAKPSG